jgi:Tfp pilus assembly protein FimT
MRARGHSLVEIVTVIGIASLLLAIALPIFSDQSRRYHKEAQTRLIMRELLQARSNAVYLRRETRLKFYPARFEIYSSKADRTGGANPVSTRDLRYPVTVNRGIGPDGENIGFTENGVATNKCSVCLVDRETAPVLDSVVISATRVHAGVKDQGEECKDDNITPR